MGPGVRDPGEGPKERRGQGPGGKSAEDAGRPRSSAHELPSAAEAVERAAQALAPGVARLEPTRSRSRTGSVCDAYAPESSYKGRRAPGAGEGDAAGRGDQ